MRVANKRTPKGIVKLDQLSLERATSEPRRFHTIPHELNKQVLLDESFAQCETPSRLIGVELYEHQKTIVQALIDLENSRMLMLGYDIKFNNISTKAPVVGTSACVLSEQFGSGKTIELFALIAIQPIPKAFPSHMNTLCCRNLTRYGTKSGFQHEIIRTYTGPRALIRATFVIVGSSVLDQWRDAAATLTDFNVLVVADQRDLRAFVRLFAENKLNSYDIVLVKNGPISGNLGFLGAAYEQKQTASMVDAMRDILINNCIARDIWDDFDTIKLAPRTQKFDSLFTIYVSATTRKNQPIGNESYNSIEDMFTKCLVSLSSVTYDDTLFSNFNVRCIPEYTERSTAITNINGWRYVYGNPDDNFIRLIGVIGDDATEIAEMLNGGAYKTAAKQLNIEKTNGADIFRCVLDAQYDKYRHDLRVIAVVEKYKTTMATMPRDITIVHTYADVEAARKALAAGHTPTLLAKDGAAITRVIENVKGGACQICQLPLSESDTFLVRCCGLIMCDICGIEGSRFTKSYNIEAKNYEMKGRCANCRHEINMRADLMFIDKNTNIEALLNNYTCEDVEPVETKEPVVEIANDLNNSNDNIAECDQLRPRNPKLAALLDICNGIVPDSRESVPVNIPQLLRGTKDIFIDGNTTRKILVFANFDETLKLVEDMLVENGITFLRLQGTYREKAASVKSFREYGTVMLINSSHSCAGLNIQFATDIVLFHKINDNNVAGQVVGRGQRVGRTCNLQLHSLLFHNEA